MASHSAKTMTKTLPCVCSASTPQHLSPAPQCCATGQHHTPVITPNPMNQPVGYISFCSVAYSLLWQAKELFGPLHGSSALGGLTSAVLNGHILYHATLTLYASSPCKPSTGGESSVTVSTKDVSTVPLPCVVWKTSIPTTTFSTLNFSCQRTQNCDRSQGRCRSWHKVLNTNPHPR